MSETKNQQNPKNNEQTKIIPPTRVIANDSIAPQQKYTPPDTDKKQ